MSKPIHYSDAYPVPVLRAKLREWQAVGAFLDFRLRIVDAIEDHSDGDRVSVRFDRLSHRIRFEEEMNGTTTTPAGVGAGSGGEGG